MKKKNFQYFTLFKVIIGTLSVPVILGGCQAIDTHKEQKPIADGPIDINHDTATLMTANEPRQFFTDYGKPDQCLLSQEKPGHDQPSWIEPETIWQRIALEMNLDHTTPNRRIDAEFRWYKDHPDYMTRVTKRAERYAYYVTEQVASKQLPMELALLPIVESAYDPFAYSHGRASGMWQFIPGTGRDYKLAQNWWYDGRRDVVASTQAALTYLTDLSKMYDNDWLLALAAYNSGQGTVSRAIRKNKKKGKPTDFWSLDLPRETRSYVPKLLALAKLFKNPQRYGISLYPVANKPFFAKVDTHSQIDLAKAAKMAELDIDEIYRLNPGFNRWATAPSGPHRLLVPIAKKTGFEKQLSVHPPETRLSWIRHKVRRGESLLLLANRFNTTAELIRKTNNIRGNTIRKGQALMIPQATKGKDHYTLSAQQRLNTLQKKRYGEKTSKQVFHTVRRGDSFWNIARKYRVSVAKLTKWNGMSPRDTLRPGQKLSVWASPKLASATKMPTRDAVVRKVGYKVRSGDSLARIAQRFNLRVRDILKWNAVNTKKYLQPGQLLTLYVDITGAIN